MKPQAKYTLFGIIAFIIFIALLFFMLTTLVSCGNHQLFDTTYTYNYAYVQWPDGHSEKLAISSWTDYEGEQLQIKTKDGKVYLFNSVNCVLAWED